MKKNIDNLRIILFKAIEDGNAQIVRDVMLEAGRSKKVLIFTPVKTKDFGEVDAVQYASMVFGRDKCEARRQVFSIISSAAEILRSGKKSIEMSYHEDWPRNRDRAFGVPSGMKQPELHSHTKKKKEGDAGRNENGGRE